MNPWWDYFWPGIATGLVVGAIAGSFAFRRRKRALSLLIGAIIVVAATALWHGPMGAAARLTGVVERSARLTLDDYEMTQVEARLYRQPLTRNLALTGPADDFQRGELIRVMSTLPGVREASWPGGHRGLPLILEAALVALAGFLFGLLLAYLVELRRRYNAQWKW